jgi:pyruvate-ferredoxin/flavodoxin oxidoreductase
MATRATGCALLCSASVQEAHDMAAIATRATLESRIPFLHFFDGFRTSHEVQKIETIPDDVLEQLVPFDLVLQHRQRALTPDRPGDSRHRPEPGCVLPGTGNGEPLLQRLCRHRAAGHG